MTATRLRQEGWADDPGLEKRLTFIFTGLCSFVQNDYKSLAVLLVSAGKTHAKHGSQHRPALAVMRFSSPGILRRYPTIKPLNGEALTVVGGKGGSVALDPSYLVDMAAAGGCAGHAEHGPGQAHDDCLNKKKRVSARLVLIGENLGCTLTTMKPKPEETAEYVFKAGPKNSPPEHAQRVVDELRLSAELPTSPLCVMVTPLDDPKTVLWSQEICGKEDWAAVVIVSNLPIHEPFTLFASDKSKRVKTSRPDDHFGRYYALARKKPHQARIPDAKGDIDWPDCGRRRGGEVPRCAMARFKA